MNSAKTESKIGLTGSEYPLLRGASYEGKAIVHPEWIEVKPGVRFQLIEIEGVDILTADGALVEMDPNTWTPFQFNASEKTTFIDCPLEGKQTMVTADPAGNVFVDFFDPDIEGTSYAVELPPGWLMATYSHKSNKTPSRRLEYEEPGFYNPETKLLDVEREAQEINGHPIPLMFWQMINRVEEGQTTL